MISFYYGLQAGDPAWLEKADIYGDGEIGQYDFDFIVNKYLGG